MDPHLPSELRNTLTSSIQSPEPDVAEPTRRKMSSFAAQLSDLDVGDMTSKVERVHLLGGADMLNGLLKRMHERTRNSINPAVARVKAMHPGRDFSVEINSTWLNSTNRMVVLAVVTRTA